MPEERRLAIMAYCRINEDDLEPGEMYLFDAMCEAAVGYMTQAGVSEPPEGTPRRAQYDLCVNYLVQDSWDRRDVSFVGASSSENIAFRLLINQLKVTEPDVSELDTSASGAPVASGVEAACQAPAGSGEE